MEGRHSEEVSNEFVVEDITFEHQGSECKMRDSVQTLKTTRRNIRYRRAIVYSETDRGMNSDNKHHEKPPNPCATASILSALTMSWTLGLFREGYKRELDVEDLYIPLKEHQSSLLGDKLEEKWKSEVSHGCKKNRDASLLRAILKTFGWKILGLGIILVVTELVTKVAQPMFLARLLRYFTPGSNISKQEAYIYAAGIITATAVNIFVLNPFWMCLMHIGMKIRVACCSLIYRKALRLSRTALGGTTVGQVVNLMSNDVSRFDVAIVFIHYLWIGPVTTAVVAYLLWMEIGISSVIGISAILLFIPLQMWLGKKRSILRLQTAILTDERVRLMNEIISGIQVIKMYAWEKPFAKLVTEARRKEVKEICGTSFIHGVLLSFVVFHNRLAIYCSIVAYVLLGNYINAATVFVITAYFHLARQMMSEYFPIGIGQIAEALISIKRLQKFMMCDETSVKLILPPGRHVKQNNTYFDTINKSKERLDGYKMIETLIDDHRYITSSSRNEKRCVDKGIIIKNVTAKWDAVGENTLTNVNLTVCPGELLVVIGPVGCGKSSLLHAVLGELKQNTGEILVSGNIAYSSQEPWLFDGTIRQNILFGADYNEDRYMETVEVCALSVDFQQFPYGDKTLVGERGITLSGGQRARINLARAVYKQADVYLLDDPLSAVDSHVGKHLFESCITGYLKDKTCILVTHQLQYLNCVNHMILMQNGLIQAEGTYQQVQTAGTDFTKLLLNSRSNETVEDYVNLEEPTWRSLNTDLSDKEDEPSQETELRSKGMDGYYVFQAYITAGGHYCIMLGLMLIFCLAQFVASGGDYWLTYWVNLEEYVYPQVRTDGKTSTTLAENITAISGTPTDIHLYIHMREYCIYIFTLLTVSCVIITLVRSYVFFIVCMRASMWLHNGMFDSISRATMRFFHTNSIGRILNRFTKDMGSVDDLLPVTLLEVLQIGLTLLGIVVVVAIINYWLIVPTLVAFCVFYIIRVFYLSTSRSVKRLEGSTRSPVFSHLSSSLQGLTTIRAFQAQQILEEAFDNHQDLHSSAWFMFLASSRAFGFWLDLVCLMYISLVTLSFLFIDWDWFGGDVGLAITQSIGLTGMFQWGIKQSAELENHMTSVERVLEYFNIEKEAPLESSPGKKPPESWPQEGRIIFNRVNLKYRPDLPLVLKDLTVTVEPKQKVGIVGRTGAGKTSMIAALFRLTEVEGDIIIDDLNIKTIGLHDLRSKITIIPQEPVLFSGTVRKNLDPFDEFSDHTLWNALEEVELKNVINEIPDGLNGRMSESGMNFSAGQRQLICLARAFVRNNRILVLDEATANVDPRTDALIQKTIRRQFADYTVITIAHRLHTVMDSDRILVMDAGHMVEYDHPHILLKNKNGYLYRMVEKTGKHTAETLHNVAALPDNLMWLDKLPALLLHWYVPVTGASLTSKMLVVHSTSDRVHSEVFSPTSVNRSE